MKVPRIALLVLKGCVYVPVQVFALDQRFLDPRRPMRAKATPQEMEERLLPFSELIPFFPNGYITQVGPQLPAAPRVLGDTQDRCMHALLLQYCGMPFCGWALFAVL